MFDITVIGADPRGKLGMVGRMVVHLTPCCDALGEGDRERVVCARCRRGVDERFELAWLPGDAVAWTRYRMALRDWLVKGGMPRRKAQPFVNAKCAQLRAAAVPDGFGLAS